MAKNVVYKPSSKYNKDLVNNPVTAPPKNYLFLVSGVGALHIDVAGRILYTVSAGKRFYLTALYLYCTASTVLYFYDQGQIKLELTSSTPEMFIDFSVPVPFMYEINLVPSAHSDFYFTLIGYEE